MSDNYPISEEIANEQFELLADYYQIDLTDLDDGDGEVASQSVKNKFLRAVRSGLLEVRETDDGLVVIQKFIREYAGLKELTYTELNGRARKSLRKIKGEYERMYTLLGVLSGQSGKIYDKMAGKDLAAAESLALLFLVA